MGARLIRKKIEKNELFLTYQRVIWILMKFDVWNDIVSQSSYFKSRPDLMTLGGVRGGKT